MDGRELISPALRNWSQRAIERIQLRAPVSHPLPKRKRKFLLIHLDGVPRLLLEEAVRLGQMPFVASLLNQGHYELDTAFWGSPASTPCFQAGLLYGMRHPNLPAYHWFDRGMGRIVRMNVPKDAEAVESRLKGSHPSSLLEGGGTSYLSLFQADATNRLNMTALANIRLLLKNLWRDFQGLSDVQRQNAFRYFAQVFRDTFQANLDARRWVRRLSGDSRHESEYLLNRFFLIQLGWGLSHSRVLIDMVRGVPAIYLVFGNYDEVAHRRGPLSLQARRELYHLDGFIAELYALAHSLKEPYDVYLVSDHGHVDSAPLEARLGARLERYLLSELPVELSQDVELALLDGRQSPPTGLIFVPEEPVVIEAGNFAHIYMSRGKAPLEAIEILQHHKAVLAKAASLKDIGLVALRRGNSAVAVIQNQVFGPDDIASAPLSGDFSKKAVADFLRELPHMPTAGDLVLFGEVCQPGGTVGFAWEFGSHGGLTRIETESIALWPKKAPVELSSLSHSTQLYQRLSDAYRSS